MVHNIRISQAIMIVLLILAASTSGALILQKRSIETTTEQKPEAECQSNTPCGWAVYTPFTRKVDYWMKNTCDCPAPLECIKSDDDLSVSAYVYRCRSTKTGDTNSS